jgi:DNA polymerase III subunit epsilon
LNEVIALDLETTGFGKSDRILEIGIVVFDASSGTPIEQVETLINPLRNIPEQSTAVHGLKAEDLSLAPTFEEIGPFLLEMIGSRRVVAHNAAFDLRFLTQEFQRLDLDPEFSEVDCTYKLTGQNLSVAANQISFEFSHHSALEDAWASLALWSFHNGGELSFVDRRNSTDFGQSFRTISRSQLGLGPIRKIESGLRNIPLRMTNHGAEGTYIGLLDSCLRDMAISSLENLGLEQFAAENGISDQRVLVLQEIYLDEIENAARRDGIITEVESRFFNQIAAAMGFDRTLVSENFPSHLPEKGSLICVTGTATVDGVSFDKATMKAFLEGHGYQFTDELSKKSGVSLLLQDSEGTLSGKVMKAQAWGIPRMVIKDFAALVSR